MGARFRCGSYSIPSGVAEVTLTGLALPFTPKTVLVSVRQPATDADLISAYVTGAPTSAGFSAALSAETPAAGYTLDWQAFETDEQAYVDGESLAVSYTDLMKAVARFLGYDYDNLTAAQTEECDFCVQSGVRNFYRPAALASHEWAFLKLDGAVQTAEGTEDYLLPDGMGNIAGQLAFDPAERRRSVVVIPFGEIEMLRRRPATGAPLFAAVVSTNLMGGNGQRKRLCLYPTPDKAYTLSFRADADQGKLDATTRPYPLGGYAYAELVLESCLSIAEQRVNDEAGLHTQNFNALLESAVTRDFRQWAQNFGFMGDTHDW